jgi:hypothetical protein
VTKSQQGSELLDSLDQLDTKQELNDDPTVNYKTRCGAGLKSVGAACVPKETKVSVNLNDSVSRSVTRLRDKLRGLQQ